MGKYHSLIGSALMALSLLWSSPLWAAATITATLDREEMQVGEEAFLTISITYDSGRPQTPNIGDNSHLSFNYMGTSSSVSIINGSRTNSMEYRYLLSADAAGVYELGGINAVVGKEVVRAEPVRFKVLSAGQNYSQQKNLKNGFSLEATVDHDLVYVGEQIIYKIKFMHKAQLAEASFNAPELGDFNNEQLGEQRNYETVIAGTRYAVTEIKMALFPTKPGHFTISPASIKGNMLVRSQNRGGGMFDDFFMAQSTKPFNVQSEPVEIEVKPLPTEGRPVGFSGLVGHYDLQYNLSKKTLKTNDSTTLTLVVEGYGNVPNLAIPAPQDNPDYKIYEDKPILDKQARGDGIWGRYVAKWALVPTKAGTFQMPQLKLSYFDPEKGSYETLQTPPQEIVVTPGAANEQLQITGGTAPVTAAAAKQQVAVLGEDVMPITRSTDRFGQNPLNKKDHYWFWPVFILPILGWLGFIIRRQQADRSPEQLAKIRANKALSQLLQDLEAASTDCSYEKLAQALRSYYAAKLQQSGCAITPQEVALILKASGLKQELCAAASAQLSQVEKAIYTGMTAQNFADLVAQIKATMNEVDHAFHNK